MTDAQIFDIINFIALLGWAALLASPLAPKVMNALAGTVMVALLAFAYTVLVGRAIAGDPGGWRELDFQTLEGITALFQDPRGVLIGWSHYLAFDLFVGAWAARTARAEGIPFWMVAPCLVFTFLAGPIGFLLFLFVRAARRRRSTATAAAS